MTELGNLTVVDYLLIGVMVAAVGYGWARGFVAVLTGVLVFVVTLFVAGRYSDPLVAWINQNWGAEAWFAGLLERRIDLPAEAMKAPASSIPWQKVLEMLQELPLPDSYKAALAQQVSEWSASAGSMSVATYLFQQIAAAVVHGLVFLALAALVGWGLTLLARLVSHQIKELPLVGTLNRALGAIALLLQAALALSFLVAMVVPMLWVYGAGSVGAAVENAALTPYFVRFFQGAKAMVFGANPTFFFLK